MPAGYAHSRFGGEVLKAAPARLKQTIYRNKRFFNIGVFGPDPLFYYRPFLKNPVTALGGQIHKEPGRGFFTYAAKVAKSSDSPNAAMAYLYGLLCHFALDSTCHPYVEAKTADGVAHTAIETSFDRYLLLKDGLNPLRYNPYATVQACGETARVIAPFFPPVTEKQMLEAEWSIVHYTGLLLGEGKYKRRLLRKAGSLAGSSMAGLIMTAKQNPQCTDSDPRLMELYQKAITLGGEFFLEMDAYLRGSGQLGSGFDHSFDVD